VREAVAQGEEAIREAEQQGRRRVSRSRSRRSRRRAPPSRRRPPTTRRRCRAAAEAAQEAPSGAAVAQQELAAARTGTPVGAEGVSKALPARCRRRLPSSRPPPSPRRPTRRRRPNWRRLPTRRPGTPPAPEAVESAPDAAPGPQPVPGLPPTQPGPARPSARSRYPLPPRPIPCRRPPRDSYAAGHSHDAADPSGRCRDRRPRVVGGARRRRSRRTRDDTPAIPRHRRPGRKRLRHPQRPRRAGPTPASAGEGGVGHGQTDAERLSPRPAPAMPGMMPGMMRGRHGRLRGRHAGDAGTPGLAAWHGHVPRHGRHAPRHRAGRGGARRRSLVPAPPTLLPPPPPPPPPALYPPPPPPLPLPAIDTPPPQKTHPGATTQSLQKASRASERRRAGRRSGYARRTRPALTSSPIWKALGKRGRLWTTPRHRVLPFASGAKKKCRPSRCSPGSCAPPAGRRRPVFAIDHGVVVVSTKEQLGPGWCSPVTYDVRVNPRLAQRHGGNWLAPKVSGATAVVAARSGRPPPPPASSQGQALSSPPRRANHRQGSGCLGLMKAQGRDGARKGKGSWEESN
jgi:hypothetical protein